MTTKLYPMSKIEFDKHFNEAYSISREFKLLLDLSKIQIRYADESEREYIDFNKDTETFEEAVTEWVQNWVKNNFEPIVIPDEYNDRIAFDAGWNAHRAQLLRINPNAIKVTE